MSQIKRKKTQSIVLNPIYPQSTFDELRNLPKGFLLIHDEPNVVAILLIINFFVGLAILSVTNTVAHFFPHLCCLTINMITTILIGREYVDTIYSLDKEIIYEHISDNEELQEKYKSFRNVAFNKKAFFLCLIVPIVFLWAIFSQHYIEIDLVGCYAVFIVCVTVSISVIGYGEYLCLLWFLHNINKCTYMHYNKNIPAYTPFLIKIATLTNHTKWCFFCEGFLYVFEYYILIPRDKVSISQLNMPDNTSFLITWFVILIVIILAFPAIIIIQESFITKIINNLKQKSIADIYEIYESEISDGSMKIPLHETFLITTIMSNIITSADYPVKIYRFGPAIISIATICMHTITLLSQLPSLKYLINQ